MTEATRSFLGAWEDFESKPEEFRELDDKRVLVLQQRGGRGKRSGLQVEKLCAKGARLFHIRSKVTRLVVYYDRHRAFADLGLAS
jgi:hypothetical protein